jgi:hypothetical protein
MQSRWSALLASCAMFVLPGLAPVHAGSTAEDLAQIEAEHVLAKARLRLVETQAQIAARQADIERQAPLVNSGMPTVAGIEGIAGKLWATLYLEHGFVAEVKEGDALANGMRVVSIAPGGVIVQTAGKRRVRLKPAAQAQENAMAPAPRGAVPAPSLSYGGSAVPSMPPMQSALPPPPGTARQPAAAGAVR